MVVRALHRLFFVLCALTIVKADVAALMADGFSNTLAAGGIRECCEATQVSLEADASAEHSAEEQPDTSDDSGESNDPLDDDLCHLPAVIAAPPMTSRSWVLHEDAVVPDRALPPADKVA